MGIVSGGSWEIPESPATSFLKLTPISKGLEKAGRQGKVQDCSSVAGPLVQYSSCGAPVIFSHTGNRDILLKKKKPGKPSGLSEP